ncbi:MAG: DUF4071 domain-containing protein [Chitinophagaceae bacterium]|nr:DUF4071 domain-containing protein [Chitinophagaceae bacterium]
MGFNKKTDFETGRTLDLDKSYLNMIKPAVEAAGLKCVRADEIVHSGMIDVPMYEQLLTADVVVADLSTSNKNAFYELGVRHALRPYTTVVICEDGIKSFPFDVNHVSIRTYHHLGEDIGFSEVMRFTRELTKAIVEVMKKTPRDADSPVYTFLTRLKAPELAAAVEDVVAKAAELNADNAETFQPAATDIAQTHHLLIQQVDDAQKRKDWIMAKSLLSTIRTLRISQKNEQREDPYILQRLALITYKSKFPNETEALLEAHGLLNLLDPQTTNDPETLGLWGAVHKRLWEVTAKSQYIDEAIRAYERGFYLKNDYYNGINFAFLLNIRADQSKNKAEAITDFVQAQRVRKEVLSICEQWVTNNPAPANKNAGSKEMKDYWSSRYWVQATIGEAYTGLGEAEKAEKQLSEAYANASEDWMRESTETQIKKLKPLLDNSPLKFIKEGSETNPAS